jgi:hypothetical protein
MPLKKYVAPRPTAADTPVKKKGKDEKERPEGMTNTEWAFDLRRHSVGNASRRQREGKEKAKERKAAAKQAAMMERAAAMAGMAAPPHFRSSTSRRMERETRQCLVAVHHVAGVPG